MGTYPWIGEWTALFPSPNVGIEGLVPIFLPGEIMDILKNKYVVTGLIVLATIALTAYVQRNVVAIPVVGKYLPG